MKLFVVGTRAEESYYNQDCLFIGSSLEKCENFIRKNPDMFQEDLDLEWYWTVCIDYLDYDMFNDNNEEYNADLGIYKKYTRDGREILEN